MNNMVITDIVSLDNKKRKVYIDGKYTFRRYLGEIRRFNIVVGQTISEKVLSEIDDIIYKRIRERALYLLEGMPRTEQNLRRKLIDNNYTDEYIIPVLEQLKNYGFIDDLKYAQDYAESMRINRGMSKKMIVLKLFEKGVPRDIIQEVEFLMPADDSELIERALNKKGLSINEIKELEPKEKQKIYRYLLNKGFSCSCINMY